MKVLSYYMLSISIYRTLSAVIRGSVFSASITMLMRRVISFFFIFFSFASFSFKIKINLFVKLFKSSCNRDAWLRQDTTKWDSNLSPYLTAHTHFVLLFSAIYYQNKSQHSGDDWDLRTPLFFEMFWGLSVLRIVYLILLASCISQLFEWLSRSVMELPSPHLISLSHHSLLKYLNIFVYCSNHFPLYDTPLT